MIIKFKKIIALIIFVIISLILTSCDFRISRTNDNFEEEDLIYNGEFSGIPDSTLLSALPVPGQAIDIDISGNYAYLTGDLGILYIINIKDKNEPEIVGKCSDLDSANIVIVKDNYAYISYTEWNYENNDAFTKCGFYIVDISDKKNPELVGNYNTGENNKKTAYGLFIDEDYAYINTVIEDDKSNIGSLEIVDISVKRKPVIVSKHNIKWLPTNIWVKDNLAYINTNSYNYENDEFTENSELVIIDVKDKNKPKTAGSCKINPGSQSLYLLGVYAYIASWDFDIKNKEYTGSMFQVLNIEDPSNIKILGGCGIPGSAWEMDSAGDFIYISNLSGGIHAIDVKDKSKPIVADILNTGGVSYDITIKGNYGYIADGFEGMLIIELSGQSSEAGEYYIDYEQGKNSPPIALIEVTGDKLEGENYQIKNPVYMSAKKTYDPDWDELDYKWIIDGNEYSNEESFLYYFDEPGEYVVKLAVSDEYEISEAVETIKVIEADLPVAPLHTHKFQIEIEYNLINKSETILRDIECYMLIPQTYYPYQVINNYIPNIQETSEMLDNNWNSLIHFEFAGNLKANEKLTASALIDITSYEFKYLNAGKSDLDYSDYNKDNKDFKKYTSDDLFIDSDNPEIKRITKSLIGNETSPVKIAKILYNFVIRKLRYDFPRAEDKKYEFLYASEILRRGKGVCVDYAILYTALLRSAGIPSRLVTGIPVYTILHEKGKEIDMGHAWVEIKLPDCGWIPIDITLENEFMSQNYYINIATEKGSGYLYKNKTMDWASYYYDGFLYSWDGNEIPLTEQEFIYKITDLDLGDINTD